MCQTPQRAQQRRPGAVHGPGAPAALPWFIPSLLTLRPAAEPALPARHRSWPGLAARADGGAGLAAPARKGLACTWEVWCEGNSSSCFKANLTKSRCSDKAPDAKAAPRSCTALPSPGSMVPSKGQRVPKYAWQHSINGGQRWVDQPHLDHEEVAGNLAAAPSTLPPASPFTPRPPGAA